MANNKRKIQILESREIRPAGINSHSDSSEDIFSIKKIKKDKSFLQINLEIHGKHSKNLMLPKQKIKLEKTLLEMQLEPLCVVCLLCVLFLNVLKIVIKKRKSSFYINSVLFLIYTYFCGSSIIIKNTF